MALSKEKLDALRIDRDAGTTVQRQWILPVIMAIVAVVGAAVGIRAWSIKESAVPVVETAIVGRPLQVNQSTILNASGYVVARRKATVSAKVTGKVMEEGVLSLEQAA